MTYEEQLSLLSDTLFNFDQKPNEALDQIIKSPAEKGIKVYRKNLFFLVYARLQEDYPATSIYLGEKNFRFLVRKFALETKIKSPVISSFSESFALFLQQTFDFHQDKLLSHLAKLDILYINTNKNDCRVPQGVFSYWAGLINDHKVTMPNINCSQEEHVMTQKQNGERYLKLGTSSNENQ